MKPDLLFGLQLSCKEYKLVPLLTEWKQFCLFVFPLEMANPQVVTSSCSFHQEENGLTFNQTTSPSEELLLEDQMRRKLKFFFMNPCEKFWARGRKPWKLVIQIIKLAMVTIQVSISDQEFGEGLF